MNFFTPFILFLAICLIISWSTNWFSEEEPQGESNRLLAKIIGSFLLISTFGLIFLRGKVGTEIPNHWFEAPEYKTLLYVMARPEKSKRSYKAIASIEKEIDTHSYEGVHGEKYSSNSYYDIKSLKLPNGSTVKFENYGYGEYLVLEEEVLVRDLKGKGWYIKMSAEPVNELD